MFYALTDSFTGNNPQQHTHGFANTNAVLAFKTRKERDEWLENTKLLKADKLTREEALKFAEIDGEGNKFARLYQSDDFHIIRKSQRKWC